MIVGLVARLFGVMKREHSLGFYFRGKSSPRWPWVGVKASIELDKGDDHLDIIYEEFQKLQSLPENVRLDLSDKMKEWPKRIRSGNIQKPNLMETESKYESWHHRRRIRRDWDCAKAMLLRGSCHEIVLIDLPEREQHTRGVRNDLSHGEPLCPPTRLTVGKYENLKDASVVVVTAGVNEKAGDAIDRKDPWGRQRLLTKNAAVYRDVIPQIVAQSPKAPIVVATDPPDSLAEVAGEEVGKSGGTNQIVSTGTFLDTLRFRIQIAQRLDCSTRSVDGYVVGEHGKTQVLNVWSSVADRRNTYIRTDTFTLYPFCRIPKRRQESGVLDANIDIIEATDASQHGIGINHHENSWRPFCATNVMWLQSELGTRSLG